MGRDTASSAGTVVKSLTRAARSPLGCHTRAGRGLATSSRVTYMTFTCRRCHWQLMYPRQCPTIPAKPISRSEQYVPSTMPNLSVEIDRYLPQKLPCNLGSDGDLPVQPAPCPSRLAHTTGHAAWNTTPGPNTTLCFPGCIRLQCLNDMRALMALESTMRASVNTDRYRTHIRTQSRR